MGRGNPGFDTPTRGILPINDSRIDDRRWAALGLSVAHRLRAVQIARAGPCAGGVAMDTKSFFVLGY